MRAELKCCCGASITIEEDPDRIGSLNIIDVWRAQHCRCINAQADVAELLAAAEFFLESYNRRTQHMSSNCDFSVKPDQRHAAVIQRWRKQVSGSQADETSKKG